MKDAPSDSFPDGNARGEGTARRAAVPGAPGPRRNDRGTVATGRSTDSGHPSDPGDEVDSGHSTDPGGPIASGDPVATDTSGPDARADAGGGAGAGRGGRGGRGGGGSGRGDGPGDPGAGPPDPGDHDDHDDHDDRDGGHGHDGLGADGAAGADEEALRRLLHQAVQDVRPDESSLERLRHAVPARRARKRQAFVGAAAAVVLLGAAVPALLHVSHATGSSGDHTAVAGHGEAVHGGTGGGTDHNTGGGRHGAGQPSGSGHAKDHGGGHGHSGHGKGSTDPGTSPDPENTLAARSPGCVPTALGNAQASVGTPDGEGRVYGTFRVSNVSGSDCTVDGAGTIATTAQGAADPSKITVVDHTAGDPAAGLPGPATQASQIILAPGQSYEVKFAWVPSASCPSDPGASPDPTSSDTPTADGGGSDTGTGTTTQLNREDGAPAEGSVAVSHTAEPGAPTAAATIPNACAGTLYRTELLPAS